MESPKFEELNCGTGREDSIHKHYPEFHQYLINTYPDLTWSEKLYWYYHNVQNRPCCSVCGGNTAFVNFRVGYRPYCSRKCMNSDPNKKEQVKHTNIKKYGGVAPACSKQIHDKMIITTEKRYGVKNAMQNPEIAQRSHQTNIDRYGGMGNASQELKVKQKDTMQKLYNADNYMQSESFYNTILEKYPDINSIDIKNKQYTCSCPCDGCNLCAAKTYDIGIVAYHNRKHMDPLYRCTITNPVRIDSNRNTSIEKYIRSILDRNNIPYEINTRSIITPQELDIYIPSHHLAIECNGIYYHNSEQKTHRYHIDKYNICKLNGIQLLSFWEDWICKKSAIIENILLSKLGIYKERIYARKCQVKPVETTEANIFLNNYHIQGGCPANIKYGLYQDDRLLCLMTFADHRNNIMGVSGWELVRFCSLTGVQVVGGAEKLLSYFIHQYHPDTIASFSMNDISNGNLYKQLGFQQSSVNQSYWYVEKDTLKRYHRSSFTKSSIIKRGWRDSKEGWREADVVREHGYYQIYDSGQTKWILNIKQH